MKKVSVEFTRAECEALLILIQHVGVSSVFINDYQQDALREVYGALPIAARKPVVSSLNTKIWECWAKTHPEEGPFK